MIWKYQILLTGKNDVSNNVIATGESITGKPATRKYQ